MGTPVMPFLSSLQFIFSRTSSFHPPVSASELTRRVQSPEQGGARSALYTPLAFSILMKQIGMSQNRCLWHCDCLVQLVFGILISPSYGQHFALLSIFNGILLISPVFQDHFKYYLVLQSVCSLSKLGVTCEFYNSPSISLCKPLIKILKRAESKPVLLELCFQFRYITDNY